MVPLNGRPTSAQLLVLPVSVVVPQGSVLGDQLIKIDITNLVRANEVKSILSTNDVFFCILDKEIF